MRGLVIWFCGLPGSGKSTISRLVRQSLALRNAYSNVIFLSMDDFRKKIFPNPRYTDEERDAAYRAFALAAILLSKNGTNVILDGTAHKRKWRDIVRRECGRDYVEVYVKCPVEICIRRETRRKSRNVRNSLYADALERLRKGKKIRGLGKVPGVDEPFEESRNPEITIDSSIKRPEELAEKVMKELSKLLNKPRRKRERDNFLNKG